MMVTQLTVWLELTEVWIKLFKDIEWNEKQTATGHGILWMLACNEETDGHEEVFVLPDFSAQFLQVIIRDSCIVTCTVGHCQ